MYNEWVDVPEQENKVETMYLLSSTEAADYRSRGYLIYVVPEMFACNESQRNYDLRQSDAVPILLSEEFPWATAHHDE